MNNWIGRIVLSLLGGVAIAASIVSVGCNRTPPPQIVLIPKNAGNPYFEPLTAGIKKAAAEHNLTFDTVAPADANATSQITLVKDQIQRGVKVIAICPNHPDALNTVLKEAMDKGVKVITVDSDLTGNEQFRNIGILTADVQMVGENQVELMGSLINYQGDIAILSATTDAPNQNAWIEVMKKTLETNKKYEKMHLVETVYGNDDPKKSSTEAEQLLSKYKDLKGIIAPTTVGIAAAAGAEATARKNDANHHVEVTGLGLPSEMRDYVKNGTVKSFALWNPSDEGYLTGQVASQLLDGSLRPAAGVTFKAGSLGDRTIGEKNVVITGPPFTFTKDNIDQFNF